MDRARANEIAKVFLQKTNPQLLAEQPGAEPLKLFIDDREKSVIEDSDELYNSILRVADEMPHPIKEAKWNSVWSVMKNNLDEVTRSLKFRIYLWILSKSTGMDKSEIKDFIWFAFETYAREKFERLYTELGA